MESVQCVKSCYNCDCTELDNSEIFLINYNKNDMSECNRIKCGWQKKEAASEPPHGMRSI